MVPGLSRLPMLQGICLQVSEARLQVWREMLLRRLTTRDYTKFSIIIIILIGIGHSYRLFSFFVIEFVFLFSCASVPQFLFSRAFLFSSLLSFPLVLLYLYHSLSSFFLISFSLDWIYFIRHARSPLNHSTAAKSVTQSPVEKRQTAIRH